ncbi:hypothetical protein WJX72_010684 [[Myrmecia] bisecta]|uniref:Uncharacterized protein n=1 Tax=[Myrmecia] bisecta TaxID=41462 RepID=A0AAW1RA78_9CHLO
MAEHPGVRPEDRQKRTPNYGLLVPLIYAPALPLLRIGLTGRVPNKVRNGILAGTILVALAHAGYVMSADSSMGAGN